MDGLRRWFESYLRKILVKFISFFMTFLQGFYYIVFKLEAIKNPDILQTKLSPINVKYFLYTKENLDESMKIDPLDPKEFKNCDGGKIIFFIHGWMGSKEVLWYEELKDAFLLREEPFYVVQVDWSGPASKCYAYAAWCTKDIGNFIGRFIATLTTDYSIPLTNIVVVGHTLGAQVAGFVGKTVLRHTKRRLPRIVALDPAGSLFNTRSRLERLSLYDAEHIQLIHSDGDTFGYIKELDGLNFYLRESYSQNYHKVSLIGIIRKPEWNQERSPMYFAQAIHNPDAFMGRKCRNWYFYVKGICNEEIQVSMGDLDTRIKGKFFI